MGKESIAAKARRLGISRQTLFDWRDKEGLDLDDEEAVQERMSLMRVDHKAKIEGGQASYDYNESRAKKEHYAAEIQQLKFEAESRSKIEREDVCSQWMKWALISRSAWMKLPNELPPMLAGLDSGEMATVLDEYARDKANELADAAEQLDVTFERARSDAEAAQENASGGVGGGKGSPAK